MKRMMSIVLGVIFLVVSGTSRTGRGEAVWTVDEEGGHASGEGVLTLSEPMELDGGLFVEPTGAGLVLTGAGIAFRSASAAVTCDSFGDVAYELPLAAAGDLSFSLDLQNLLVIWEGGYLRKTNDLMQTLFVNRNLAELDVVSGKGGGTALVIGVTMNPVKVERGEGWLTVQLQVVSGGWAKCVKVRLEQRGADIAGGIVYAKYSDTSNYGMDFDQAGTDQDVATGDDVYGFGVTSLSLMPGSGGNVGTTVVRGPIRLGADGRLSVGEGLRFVADGDDVLGADGRVTNDLQVDGTLVVTNTQSLVFDGVLSGNGSLTFGGLIREVECQARDVNYDQPMPTSWTTVVEDTPLSALTNVHVNAYSGVAIEKAAPGDVFFLRMVDGEMVCQCQGVDGALIKGVYLHFRQSGTDIEAKISDARYTSTSTGLGVDWDTLTVSTAGDGTLGAYTTGSTPGGYNYGLGSITMQFRDLNEKLDLSQLVNVTLAGTNNMSGAHFVQNGGVATVTHLDGLPVDGSYKVNGGTLTLKAAGADIYRGLSRGRCLIHVKDGVLSQEAPNMLDATRQTVELDNSELRLLPNMTSGRSDLPDSDTYVNSLTLRNGSRVTTKWPRIGYVRDAVWKVAGTSPSWCEYPLLLASTGGHVLTLDVDDVTGDEGVDLDLRQGIRTYDSNLHTNISVRKTGSGTVALNGPSFWFRTTRLCEGTMLFGVSDAGRSYTPCSFEGGTLALAAGTVNSTGPITLSADSAIRLADGAVLQVADSSACAWTPGATLTVYGNLDPRAGSARSKLRFGGDVGALTSAQRRALRWIDAEGNALPLWLDDDGFAVSSRPGICLIVR